jgi:hypothetical protein
MKTPREEDKPTSRISRPRRRHDLPVFCRTFKSADRNNTQFAPAIADQASSISLEIKPWLFCDPLGWF